MIRAAIVGIGRWGRTLVGGGAGQERGDPLHRRAQPHPRQCRGVRRRARYRVARQPRRRSSPIRRSTRSCSQRRTASTAARSSGRRRRQARLHGKAVHPRPQERRRALDAVARAGVTLGVAYPRRFHPSMQELKARIDDGRLGTIAHCHGEQNAPAGLFMNPASWRADAAEAPAGGMTASGVHNLDAMIGLFGPIDEVYATSRRRAVGYDAEDTTSVMLGFANGVSATLLCCIATAVGYRLAVFGSKGCAELRDPAARFSLHADPRRDANRPPHPAGAGGHRASRLQRAARRTRRVRGGDPRRGALPDPAEEVLHCVAAFEAIVRSAARHQPVRVARD